MFLSFSLVCVFIDLSEGLGILILQTATGVHAIIVARKVIMLSNVPYLGVTSRALFVEV